MAYYYTLVEDYEEALRYYKMVIEDPDFNSVNLLLSLHRVGMAYWNSGSRDEGKKYFEQQIKALNEINALGRGSSDSVRTSYDLAAIYAFQGEKEKAYYLLENYVESSFYGLYGLNLIKRDPMFKSVRNEPRAHYLMI